MVHGNAQTHVSLNVSLSSKLDQRFSQICFGALNVVRSRDAEALQQLGTETDANLTVCAAKSTCVQESVHEAVWYSKSSDGRSRTRLLSTPLGERKIVLLKTRAIIGVDL